MNFRALFLTLFEDSIYASNPLGKFQGHNMHPNYQEFVYLLFEIDYKGCCTPVPGKTSPGSLISDAGDSPLARGARDWKMFVRFFRD